MTQIARRVAAEEEEAYAEKEDLKHGCVSEVPTIRKQSNLNSTTAVWLAKVLSCLRTDL